MTDKPSVPMPTSLTGHVVPADRLEGIQAHVKLLSETALAVSDTLPLGADVGDMVAVMEREEG